MNGLKSGQFGSIANFEPEQQPPNVVFDTATAAAYLEYVGSFSDGLDHGIIGVEPCHPATRPGAAVCRQWIDQWRP